MQDQATNPEAWAQVGANPAAISTTELDSMIVAMQETREKYEAQKEVTTGLYNEYEDKRAQVLEALSQLKKTKYVVEGLGTVSVVNKFVVTTPKTIEDKKAFFEYLRKAHGETVFWDKVGVNHQTLQTIYNSDMEAALEEGKADFTIPGLQEPTAMQELRLTKERAKNGKGKK